MTREIAWEIEFPCQSDLADSDWDGVSMAGHGSGRGLCRMVARGCEPAKGDGSGTSCGRRCQLEMLPWVDR